MDNRISEWTPGKRPQYMKQLTRNQASLIFKTRSRMLRIKDNYKKEFPNQTCRACDQQPETQHHILVECNTIHRGDHLKVQMKEVFDEHVPHLKKTAKKIEDIMNTLEGK